MDKHHIAISIVIASVLLLVGGGAYYLTQDKYCDRGGWIDMKRTDSIEEIPSNVSIISASEFADVDAFESRFENAYQTGSSSLSEKSISVSWQTVVRELRSAFNFEKGMDFYVHYRDTAIELDLTCKI